jgi:hypothetical protein
MEQPFLIDHRFNMEQGGSLKPEAKGTGVIEVVLYVLVGSSWVKVFSPNH